MAKTIRVLFCLGLLWASPGLAAGGEEVVEGFRRLFALLETDGSLEGMPARSAWPKNDLLASYLELELLFHPETEQTTPRLMGFLEKWPRHPQADRVVKIMEKRVLDMEPEAAENWYAKHPPKQQLNRLQHVGGLVAGNRAEEAYPLWRDLYREGSAVVTPRIGEDHPFWARLTQADHETRLRVLIGNGSTTVAGILKRLPAPRRAFFQTMELARKNDPGFQAALKKLTPTPQDLQELWRERFEAIHRAGQKEKLLAMLEGSEGKLLAPEDRQKWRFHYGRAMLFLNRDYKGAYRLLQENVREKGGALEDSVWLAGWSALNDGNRARAEVLFQQLAREGATTPGRSQGAYWAARMNQNPEQKQFWFTAAARHLDNLYGLLAREELHGTLPPFRGGELSPCPEEGEGGVGKLKPEDEAGLRLLQAVGRDWYNGPEIQKLGERLALTTEERLCLAIRHGASDLAIKLASELGRKERYFWRGLFPVPKWRPDSGWQLAPALIWGTSRQESQFFPRAESSAKALGVMQLMPDTAAGEARQSGFPPSSRLRLQIPGYNLSLGQAYMQRVLKQFDGDLVLALIAYNAGPTRAKNWMERRKSEDPMTFIENIPITETRNYVKRVVTGVEIYRLQLDGSASVKADIAPGGPGLAALKANGGT